MSNPAPVLILRGTVHGQPEKRTVAPVEAQPAQYDEQGNFLRRAVEPKPGYEVHDLTILTEGGGFASVVMKDEAVELARTVDGFSVPAEGDSIEIPVYAYDQWRGNGRRYKVTAYSLAGSAYKAFAASRGNKGSRVALAPTGS